MSDIDVEYCANCGGHLKIIAAIVDPAVITKILTHLHLPARAPPSLRRGGSICSKRPDRTLKLPSIGLGHQPRTALALALAQAAKRRRYGALSPLKRPAKCPKFLEP